MYENIVSTSLAMFPFRNIVVKSPRFVPRREDSDRPRHTGRLLKVSELVRREGKRYDKTFAGVGRCGDVDAHLGAQARHQVEADARCALGGAAVVAGKALLEHARQR